MKTRIKSYGLLLIILTAVASNLFSQNSRKGNTDKSKIFFRSNQALG